MKQLLKRLLKRSDRSDPAPAPYCAAVVVAAGRAARMEGVDKILAPLGGTPILLHALAPLQNSDQVDEIILVTREDLMVKIGALCTQRGFTKVRRVVKGGSTRTQSVLAGIGAVSPQTDLIAIHDGARPFLTPQVLEEVLTTGRQRGAAAPAIPVKDTIKTASEGVVTGTPDRATLFAVQTPQVFEASLIRGALTKAQEEGADLTDDCSAVERLGFPVCLTKGSEENIKITTPRDLIHGEAILAERMGL
jgi:2-C-methyl-D-erythritol 4-phosphate cytidylyltransferase